MIKPLPLMRPAVFFRLRLSLQNRVALLTPILSFSLVQSVGGSQWDQDEQMQLLRREKRIEIATFLLPSRFTAHQSPPADASLTGHSDFRRSSKPGSCIFQSSDRLG